MTRDEALQHQINGARLIFQNKVVYISQLCMPSVQPAWAYVIQKNEKSSLIWGQKVLLSDLVVHNETRDRTVISKQS
jgi:hypothetical protein